MQASSVFARDHRLNQLSGCVVNGQIVHKIDLIAIIRICGVHYFNVYRRYNSVFEIVIEDCRGDLFVQTNGSVRTSLQTILCLSEQQGFGMYSTGMYSFRHGGVPPTSSPAFENMTWTEVQAQWAAVDVNLRGILEEYHDFVRRFYQDRDEDHDGDREEDQDGEQGDEKSDDPSDDQGDEKSDEDMSSFEEESEEEDPYADMPALIDDSDEEEEEEEDQEEDQEEDSEEEDSVTVKSESDSESSVEPVVSQKHAISVPVRSGKLCSAMKRTFTDYSSESDSEADSNADSNADSYDEEKNYIILRNGTKYRRMDAY